jgi:hypothetical protein
MASTYSDLKFELIGTGDQAGTWGATTNTNLGTAIQQAITGTVDVAFSSSDVTLTLTDTNAAQNARALRLNLTGTSGGARNLIVPAIAKQYIINNGLADAVTVKNSSGTGIAVAAGKTMLVFNNATNVVDVTNYLSSLALGAALPVTSGGTGVTTSTGTGAVVLSNTPTLVTPVLGVASATTVNKVTLTAPATGSTLTIADGKTLTASNSITLAGTDSTTMTFPTVSSSVGYLNIPINSQSAAYTTVLADSGKTILHPSTDANARTFTIDSNANVAYALGTAITFINMTSQVVTIAITSDTMYLAGPGTTGSRSLAQYGMATAVKLTSTTWIISGNGLT